MNTHTAAAGNCEDEFSVDEAGFRQFVLLKSDTISPDSRLLRFALPPSMPTLGAMLPSCLSLKHTVESADGPQTLTKSYSPVSLPEQSEFFELVVKARFLRLLTLLHSVPYADIHFFFPMFEVSDRFDAHTLHAV